MRHTYKQTRLVLLGALAILALGAVASASASAALPSEGPWWHVNGKRLTEGKTEKVLISSLTTPTIHGKYGENLKIAWRCSRATLEGTIDNGKQTGEYKGSLAPKECGLYQEESPGVYRAICPTSPPHVVEVKGSLWYHATSTKEKTSKIQLLLEPASGTTLFKFTLAGEACGAFEGTDAVTGDMAAEVQPEGKEAEVGKLVFPAEPQHYMWRPKSKTTYEEAEAKLTYGGREASFESEMGLELSPKEKFGVYES